MRYVAVIMSVYHGDDPLLFDEALNSIFDQELPEGFESRIYIAVDGPLGDGLNSVLGKYESRFYGINRNIKNIGLSSSLNLLINKLGQEEYIFRMDADDRSSPMRFYRQIEYLEACGDIDILGTAIVENDIETNSRRIVRFAEDSISARRDIAKRPPIAHPTACFRRRVFDAVGGYPSVPFSEDIALWFKCLEKGIKFDNLPDPFYEFTINRNFWKRRGFRKAWGEYKTWSSGVHRLDGATWRQVYPFARLLVRIGPKYLQKTLYSKFMRKQVALKPE